MKYTNRLDWAKTVGWHFASFAHEIPDAEYEGCPHFGDYENPKLMRAAWREGYEDFIQNELPKWRF